MNQASGSAPGSGLVSIGYEGRRLAELVAKLQARGVSVVADVRLNAVSRRPGFSKRALADALAGAEIDYEHLRALGNPKENRSGFRPLGDTPARATFRQRLTDPSALADLHRLRDLAAHGLVAVLCFERDERHCHRELILKALQRRPDGTSTDVNPSHTQPEPEAKLTSPINNLKSRPSERAAPAQTEIPASNTRPRIRRIESR